MVFRLRLSRIKCSQVMSMVKFSPTALNLGYDFVLLVNFLEHPVSATRANKKGWEKRKKNMQLNHHLYGCLRNPG